MAKTLSEDLRVRVIAAVQGGLSRHAAAERFGIAVATAVRWLRVWHEARGGDRHTARIEGFGAVILDAIEAQVDITLVELAALLEREHGERFAPSTIWRFLDRRGLTFKKKPRTPASRGGPTSPPGAKPGSRSSQTLIPNAWSSSTRPAPRPRWHGCGAGHPAANAVGRQCRTDTGRPRPSPAHSGSPA
jgi:transposase